MAYCTIPSKGFSQLLVAIAVFGRMGFRGGFTRKKEKEKKEEKMKVDGRKKIDKGKLAKTICGYAGFMLVFVILGIILVYILHVNIVPYQKVLAALSNTAAFQPNTGLDVLFKIPFVGGAINGIVGFLIYSAGAIAFFVVQFVELLPKFIYRIPNILKGVISEGGQNYNIKDGDSKTIRKAKKALNTGYAWALAYVDSLSFWMYVFDFFVCLMAYPPISGVKNPLDAIPSLIGTIYYQEWTRIEFFNIFLLAFTVYGVEKTLEAIFAVNDLMVAYRKGGKNP